MDIKTIVSRAKTEITMLAGLFDNTDEAISAGLKELVDHVGSLAATLKARRKAAEDQYASYLKRVEDNKAEVLAKEGKLPPPITASLGLPA